MTGRPHARRLRTLALLALGPAPDHRDDLVLPEAWGGRVNVGLDVLPRSAIRQLRATPQRFDVEPEPDPLFDLRRRLHGVLIGGRATLSAALLPTLERECARLRARLFPTGADALRHLIGTALQAGRALDGRRLNPDTDGLAQAWLTAAAFERAATEALVRASWAPP